MAAAQCSWRAWMVRTLCLSAIAVAQCIFASPSSAKWASTPSATNTSASTSCR
jgi:hypothetical protein